MSEENKEDNKKDAIQIIAEEFGKTKSEVQVIMTQILKKGTLDELKYFLNVAKSVDLNPFLKEIWAYKDTKGNLLIYASRDGFRKIAQRNDNFISINSMDVCENDDFEMWLDEENNTKIKHSIKNFKERGNILGAYSILKTKNGISIEWADIKIYDKGQFTWVTHKPEMIKKVADVHNIKKNYSIGGLYIEEEMSDTKNIINIDDSNNTDEITKELITKELSEITNISDLNSYYNENKNKYNKNTFNKLIAQKQNELENL